MRDERVSTTAEGPLRERSRREGPRIYLFDNLKAILMTLVVFGHMIELVWGDMHGNSFTWVLYIFIYLFHMPLFVFCSGYLAKYRPGKTLAGMVYPYLVFQLAYLSFERAFMGSRAPIQLVTPYWIMWYLSSLIIWVSMLPMIEVVAKGKKGAILASGLALAIGLLSGFDASIGLNFNIGRTLYFLPFFVAGVAVKRAVKMETLLGFGANRYVKYGLLALSAATGVLVALFFQGINIHSINGHLAYSPRYTFLHRVLFYLLGIIVCLFLIAATPRKKTFYSYIGQRTIQVFLPHAFVVRLLSKSGVFAAPMNEYVRLLAFAGVSVVVVCVFSSKAMGMLLAPLLAWPFRPFRLRPFAKG